MSRVLEFQDIRKSFDQGAHYLSASGYVDQGEVLLIRGPSGAGKSTLLKILARLIRPDQGMIYWEGQPYRAVDPALWRRKIHYVPQKAVMFEGTVLSNLQTPFRLSSMSDELRFDQEAALKYMELLGLHPDMLEQQAGTLSGGESARVALIRALLIQPQVLLLDEPNYSLDDERRYILLQVLVQWLKEDDKRAILMVSHNAEDIKSLPFYRVLEVSMHKGAE